MAKEHPLPSLPGRYRLWPSPERALLGTGGASAVWRVQDEALGLLVAMKVLKSEGRRFHARLEREAVLSSKVVHPNLIALHDVGRTPDGKSYLAFALASDGSMLDLAPSPPDWSELKRLSIELLAALAALHAGGILHLDVKLSNLLMHRLPDGLKQLWLADLGVARAFREEDEDKSVVGTVSYMAPERLTGQHHLWCPSTDLFAVGAVLYRLVTGRLPYPARDPAEGMSQRMSPPPRMDVRPGLRVPAGLDAVILATLQPDPRGRFDLAADMIRALESLPEIGQEDRLNAADWPIEQPSRRVPTWYRPAPWPVPEQLHRPHAPQRIPQAPSLLAHREIRLVGRDSEMDRLWRAARAAMRTRRPVLLELTGPRGVGRSRLVDDFLSALEQAGLGEGVPMDFGAAQGPQSGLRGAWRRIFPPGSKREPFISEIAGTLARDRGSTLGACLPDAELLARFISPAPEDPPLWNRSALRAMLVEHLQRRAWRGLCWLRVDDAHLAGENDDVWPIVDQIMALGAPVLVILSTRSDHLSPSLLELRALHHRAARTVEVGPLDPDQTVELVEAHLPLEPGLATAVAHHGRGLPRSIHDLLIWWISSGKLEEQDAVGRGGRRWSLLDRGTALPADALAFARARLHDVAADAAALGTLRALAASGPGTPTSVLERVAGEGLDRLVIERLVDLEGGLPVFNPPELAEVLRAGQDRSSEASRALHAALARAWAAEGDTPDVLARVGSHLQEAGQAAEALGPLDLALRGLHQTLTVPQVCELAGRVIGAAESTGQRGCPAWVDAALVLADARWRRGDDAGAAEVDAAIAQEPLSPTATLLAANARIRRVGAARVAALDDLDRLRPFIAAVPPHVRADFHLTVALVRAWRLDVEGALAELHDALAHQPRAETTCQARLLRARLLRVVDPVVGWHEVLRAIETARDHGLLRYEVLAWGLAAPDMVTLGRGEEAIERLRTGVDRLRAHGELRASHEARLHHGAALQAAGRYADARRVWQEAMDAGAPAFGTFSTDARAALGVLAALENRPDRILELMPTQASWLGPAVAWALLAGLAQTLRGGPPSPPRKQAVEHALALGAEGLFLVGATADALGESGQADAAAALLALLGRSCARVGVDPAEGDPLKERFHRARR